MPGETDLTCPCCRALMCEYGYDGPFCWDCGLYVYDDPAKCDELEHPRRTRAMLCVRGLGWPVD